MNEDASIEGLTQIKHRHGYFGDHNVDGKWFEDQCGKRSWLVKLVSPHRWGSYWITDNEFRSAMENIPLSGKPTITRGEAITNLDSEVKQVLLNAIHKWEGEPASS